MWGLGSPKNTRTASCLAIVPPTFSLATLPEVDSSGKQKLIKTVSRLVDKPRILLKIAYQVFNRVMDEHKHNFLKGPPGPEYINPLSSNLSLRPSTLHTLNPYIITKP